MGLQACSPAVTICRQTVANLNRLSDPAECLLTNGSKVTLAPLIAAHIAPGDDVSFPLPNSSTSTAEILVAKNSLTGSGRDVYQAPLGSSLSQKKINGTTSLLRLRFVRPTLGSRQYFCLARLCVNISIAFRKEKAQPGSKRLTRFFKFLVPPPPVSSAWLSSCGSWNLKPSTARAANTFSWSVHSTFSATLGCEPATTHYSKIPKRRHSSHTVGSARCWFPANGRATDRHFSPGASLRSCQSGTGGASMRPCANVSSIRTALFTATSAGGSSFGSILASSTRSGTPPGTDGSICSEPRWRSTPPS